MNKYTNFTNFNSFNLWFYIVLFLKDFSNVFIIFRKILCKIKYFKTGFISTQQYTLELLYIFQLVTRLLQKYLYSNYEISQRIRILCQSL